MNVHEAFLFNAISGTDAGQFLVVFHVHDLELFGVHAGVGAGLRLNTRAGLASPRSIAAAFLTLLNSSLKSFLFMAQTIRRGHQELHPPFRDSNFQAF